MGKIWPQQAIQTKHLGPTKFKGDRIKATSCGGETITLSWNDNLNQAQNHKAAANALKRKLNWKGRMIMGSFNYVNFHVFAKERRI